MYWKKWAAKHEYEELKEGAWLEPGLALFAKESEEELDRKASQCGQEDLFERRLDEKKAFRYWMGGCQSVSSLPDRERHREAQALPLSRMARSEARYSRGRHEVGNKKREPQKSGNGVSHPRRTFEVL